MKRKNQKKYTRVVKNDDDSESGQNMSWSQKWIVAKQKLVDDWGACKSAISEFPKDIYFVFYLKFLESYSYFALSQILVIYLHNEFGVSDIEAGMVYGMWGAAITLWGLLVSWINDNLGVRYSLMAGFTISALSSTIVACSTSKILLYVTLFAIYPFGTSMGIPMLTVAIKRYTKTKYRGFAFGLYYSVMNVAALVSGPVVDGFNIGLRKGVNIGSVHWTGNRLVIFTCTIANVISLYIAYRYLREIKVTDDPEVDTSGSDLSSSIGLESSERGGDRVGPSQFVIGDEDDDDEEETGMFEDHEQGPHEKEGDESTLEVSKKTYSSAQSPFHANGNNAAPAPATALPLSSGTEDGVEAYVPKPQDPWTTAQELVNSPTFWRFAALTLLLVNLHAIFRHLDATLPTYLVRCFGADVPKGTLYSINPFMIIFLTPAVAALTNNYNHFDMIKWGGYLTAASPFFPAMSTSIWAVVCMNVLLSLGEAVWSPRLYDYVMTVAPEGRESSFSALASAPLFAAKIPVGLMSGYLLATYLPEDGHQRPRMLWLIIGIMTMTSPILITLFDPCIREPSKAESLSAEGSNNDGDSGGGDIELERSISNVDVTIFTDSEHCKVSAQEHHLLPALDTSNDMALHVAYNPRAESLVEY